VGWLDNVQAYSRGEVEGRLLQKMKLLASKPVELYRGKHVCELCIEPSDLVKTYMPNGIVIDPDCSWARWVAERSSNGEIRVARAGIIYAAPVLIIHNIEIHGYLPPDEFLLAVEEAPSS
jgi:hypothetical protein